MQLRAGIAQALSVVQIRIFPSLEKTIAYAQMLEKAGASLVAVHGRTREQKTAREVRADWNAIKVSRPRVKAGFLKLALLLQLQCCGCRP